MGARFRAIPAEAADLGANCLVRVSLTVAVAADGAPPTFRASLGGGFTL